jgi:cytochrome bd-type quinol oxidase subunit 2
MHHDTFNADFYVVAATVIPVLYLALTLQGQTYEWIISQYRKVVREFAKAAAQENPEKWVMFRTSAPIIAIALGSYAIVLPALLGELSAIMALYKGSASHGTTQFVFVNFVILLIVVLAGPVIQYASVAVAAYKEMKELLVSEKAADTQSEPPPEKAS